VERETARTPNSFLQWDTPVSPSRPGPGDVARVLTAFPACFLGALQFVAGKAGNKSAANAKIQSSVTLGHSAELDGFALKVDLKVLGVEDEALIKAAHEVVLYRLSSLYPSLTCPFA